jgi:EAL domain-containing protein (putative c-di-GMP-specific phosphodiesterase class I)
LELKVVAEGTDSDDQIAELKRLGCEMAQGFLYSPPVDSAQALELLLASQRQTMTV